MPVNEWSTHIPYHIKHLHDIRRLLNEFLFLNNVRFEIISQIELCIYEALSNIIEHSEPSVENDTIRLLCVVNDTYIETTIKNRGEKFDIHTASLPDINSHFELGRNRGLGIYIIRKLMDEVGYSYELGCNILRLKKNL